MREHARAAEAVAPERHGERSAREHRLQSGAIECTKSTQGLEALGDLGTGRVEADHQRRALAGDDLEQRDEPFGLDAAQRAARETVLDDRHAHATAVERAPPDGDVARALALCLEGERAAHGLGEGRHRRAHNASARITIGCFASRPAPCAICWRQLVPAAAMHAPAAARTAGSKAVSPIFIETS